MKTYEPSGRFSASVFLFAALAAGLLGGTGWLYQKLIDWIPFIYLNFLLTLGMGFLAFFMVSMAISLGRCRSGPIGILVGLVVGLFGVAATHYFAWKFAAAEVAQELGVDAGLLPLSVYIDARVETGWSLGREGGLELTGAFVWILWAIEAAIIAGGGVMGAFTAWTSPFCERCVKWTDDAGALVIGEPGAAFFEAVEGAGSIGELMAVPPNQPEQVLEDTGALVFKMSLCPTCKEVGFLSVTNMITTVDDKGEQKSEEKDVHSNLVMGRGHIEDFPAFGERIGAVAAE